MLSYDLSDHDLLEREVKRLPLQAQVLFPIEFLRTENKESLSCRPSADVSFSNFICS